MAALEPIKDNEEAVRAYGVHLGTEMCKKIMASGIKNLHLYTLNMEKSALGILMVGFVVSPIHIVFGEITCVDFELQNLGHFEILALETPSKRFPRKRKCSPYFLVIIM